VFLAHNSVTNTLYAIKAVSRKVISKYSIEEHMKVERRILLKVDHPFIVKLVKTMKDSFRIYYILEYIRGTGLFETLHILELLKNEDCKFYIGNIILMLEHLHERSIIYRDLKPENLMIDEEGYLKLIDFGTAKLLDGKTYTMLGTPQYIAPEVILGKGYSLTADIWSLGIVSYELVTGSVPFGENEQDPYKIYEKILECELIYPSTLKNNPRIKIFIDQLLCKNPAARGTAVSLKTHKWFANFNWEGLFSKNLKPPYIPIIFSTNAEINNRQFEGKEINQIFLEEERKTGGDDSAEIPSKNVEEDWDAEF
jgi:cGMP-dependent protein kinase